MDHVGLDCDGHCGGSRGLRSPSKGKFKSQSPKRLISMSDKMRPGDLVEVKSPREIQESLDNNGTLNGLPFMPEMLPFCSKRFRVSLRAVKTCYYGESSGIRRFPSEDVVLLEGVRCSGADHDGCQKACRIFWKESWLRRVEDASAPLAREDGNDDLRATLKTVSGPDKYFCQSSEILRSTVELSRWDRITKCFEDIRYNNCGVFEMLRRIGVWSYWKARRVLFGPFGRGSGSTTPSQTLRLEPGDLVEVKSMDSIRQTLDERAYNRGLLFTPSMKNLCGQQRKVERKIEKIIVDGTGVMRTLRNTVYLEGELCECSCVAFGGCPRGEFSYWREIWLQRSEKAGGQ